MAESVFVRVAHADAVTRREARCGVRAMLPLFAGIAPFGMVVGAAVASHGSPLATWFGTWTIYSGSAHLAVIDRVGSGSAAAAIFAGLVVNVRLVAFSAALAPSWRDASTAFKLTMAATIVGPGFAVAQAREREPGTMAGKRAFYTGAALALWFGWMLAVTCGVVLGERFEFATALQITVPLCLTALVVPACTTWPGSAAVVAAVGVTVATSPMLGSAALLAGTVAGAVVGTIFERRVS
jgi:predicted branched-subunit amino acid permease